ncbi:hypothetical protein H2684_04930 [Clostridium sp. cel8]|jgi:hypothetical protein|uniref:hypothetical protein n=1 Tax=unclassified Clostridium TaxID=2614128 RepID=UPI0015F3CB7A|nr:hypothetical protein [Clostridium sp. cel8]MBA5850665.1 hypothetical protein [Clostridium sp. cel8]
MGLKDKISQYYTKSYFKKYGDRITQLQGTVVSIKTEKKSILWIFNKLVVTILVKPERSRRISKCIYKRNRWFKKPTFIPINQGNLVLIQGLKGKRGKKNREQIELINVRNMTTKRDLIPMEGKMPRIQRKIERYR